MANKNNVAQFTLTAKREKYNGNEYYNLVGSFGLGANDSILVSIACDSSGQPKVYTSEKGDNFVYARAVKYRKGANGTGSKRNQLV